MFWSWTATRVPLPSFWVQAEKQQEAAVSRFFQKTTAKSLRTFQPEFIPSVSHQRSSRSFSPFEWSNGALRRLFACALSTVEHSTNLRLFYFICVSVLQSAIHAIRWFGHGTAGCFCDTFSGSQPHAQYDFLPGHRLAARHERCFSQILNARDIASLAGAPVSHLMAFPSIPTYASFRRTAFLSIPCLIYL